MWVLWLWTHLLIEKGFVMFVLLGVDKREIYWRTLFGFEKPFLQVLYLINSPLFLLLTVIQGFLSGILIFFQVLSVK